MFGGLPLVIDPNANEAERVLDELVAVMAKYGYILKHQENCIVLAKVSDGMGMEAIVAAEIQQIDTKSATWRPVRSVNRITRTQ